MEEYPIKIWGSICSEKRGSIYPEIQGVSFKRNRGVNLDGISNEMSITINISNLPPGIYDIKVSNSVLNENMKLIITR